MSFQAAPRLGDRTRLTRARTLQRQSRALLLEIQTLPERDLHEIAHLLMEQQTLMARLTELISGLYLGFARARRGVVTHYVWIRRTGVLPPDLTEVAERRALCGFHPNGNGHGWGQVTLTKPDSASLCRPCADRLDH